jgi:hypothetical protein
LVVVVVGRIWKPVTESKQVPAVESTLDGSEEAGIGTEGEEEDEGEGETIGDVTISTG